MSLDRRNFDVIVVGCGGIGSAATYWLARSGAKVLAIEQFNLDHHRGSSQDHSRIIRRSYHDPRYTVLMESAYEVWREIEEVSAVKLYVKTGGLDLERIGTTGPKDLTHCAISMTEQGVPFEEIDAREIQVRWPQFRFGDDVRGLFQSDGGLIDARKSTSGACRAGQTAWSRNSGRAPVTGDSGQFNIGRSRNGRRNVQRPACRHRRWRMDKQLLGHLGVILATDGDAGAGDLFRHAPYRGVFARSFSGLDLASA